MQVRIFTFPFDEKQRGFNTATWDNWKEKTALISYHIQFFQQDGKAYWSIFAFYKTPQKTKKKMSAFTPAQRDAWNELKNWRKARAEKDGLPGFLIATNQEIEDIIFARVQTLEALKNIKGYGPKKVAKYGKEILSIIQKHLGS